jgi:hypothetical protein
VPSAPPLDPAVASLIARARAKGPIAIPSPGEHLPETWGTKVPRELYAAIEKLGNRSIPYQSPSGVPTVVYLALPAQVEANGARVKSSAGICTLTVVGWEYPDHWEYSYSYLSGDCGWDSGTPPQPGGGGGTPPDPVGTPSANIPNCPMPSGAAGTDAEKAINKSASLKDLTTFLANNHNIPKIQFNTTDQPMKSDGKTGIAAIADYKVPVSDGTIVIYTKGVAASGQPLEQVLYHELLHYYLHFAQWDLVGSTGTAIVAATGTATATINNKPYTFDLTDHTKDGGQQSYEHVLVHNLLVDAFGADRTGALSEALYKTSPALTADEKKQILKDYATKKLDASVTATIPKGQTCGVTKYQSGRDRAPRSSRMTHDFFTDNGITFDATYDATAPPITTYTPPAWCVVDGYGYCGYYWYLVADSCDPGWGATPYYSSWYYEVWNAYTGQTTDFSGLNNPNVGSCGATVTWNGDPQTRFGDPNLPGPYDYPTP